MLMSLLLASLICMTACEGKNDVSETEETVQTTISETSAEESETEQSTVEETETEETSVEESDIEETESETEKSDSAESENKSEEIIGIFKEAYGKSFDYCDITYAQETNTYTIRFSNAEIGMAVQTFKGMDKESYETQWNVFVKNIKTLATQSYNSVIIMDRTAHVTVELVNDENYDEVFLSYSDGDQIYNVLE